MPETFREKISRVLRDFQGYTGDGQGGVGDLPVGDRSTAQKRIEKRDLREMFNDYADVAESAADSAINAALYDPTVRYKTAELLMHSSRAAKGAGTVWQGGQGYYEETDPSTGPFDKDTNPSGYHVLTDGGVKLRVLNSPTIDASAFGKIGEGVADNSAVFNEAIEYCASQGGGTVMAPCGIYPTQNYVRLLQGVKLAAYFPAFNTEGGAVTFKMDAAHNAQPFGTGSVRAGLLFAGVKGVGCHGVNVDMNDAPDGSIGVLGAGFWYSDLDGIFVEGLGGVSGDRHSQIGILFCTMHIGVFWNNHKYLRVTSNSGFAGTQFRVTSDRPYGGGAVAYSQPNQQTFTQCKVNGDALIGFDFDGIGGGIECQNCQAENGSVAGTAVKVQGTNPDVKPKWVGGEVNGFGTGFDGEIMTEEVLFAGATAAVNGGTPFTNGAQYRFLGLQRVSRIGITTPSNRKRARMEYNDLVVVPDGVATALFDMADYSGGSSINAENMLVFITARASGNAARHWFGQVPVFSRFTSAAIGGFIPTEFGTSLGITLSLSGTLVQMTQTSGGDVAVNMARLGGVSN